MVVSAIPFTGNKRKIWSQIEPLIPKGKVFVDLFTGGGTVALNASKDYETVYATDVIKPLYQLHKDIQSNENFIKTVEKINRHYSSDKEGYLKLREDYNLDPTSAKLLNLVWRSNTNYMRFSGGSEWKFNVPYGKRNHFNKERLQDHIENTSNIDFSNVDYTTLVDEVEVQYWFGRRSDVVFYADCPYSNTTAPYNGVQWTLEDDKILIEKCCYLQEQGYTVVMSNVLRNRGQDNPEWLEFSKNCEDKFTVHKINRSYNNSSFRKSNNVTEEVLFVSK